ncbi:hypothetical protein [Actinomadura nitritigenes]
MTAMEVLSDDLAGLTSFEAPDPYNKNDMRNDRSAELIVRGRRDEKARN